MEIVDIYILVSVEARVLVAVIRSEETRDLKGD